jgi:nucleotide-binding universal stress UspA family protein
MGLSLAQPLRRTQPALSFRRIVVPVLTDTISAHAVAIASRLADDDALLNVIAVVEVPAELPLDAHMLEEEAALKPVLKRAVAIGERYGASVKADLVRGRAAGQTIVEHAALSDVELIVLSAPRTRRARAEPFPFGRTVEYVLEQASCRVLLAALPATP